MLNRAIDSYRHLKLDDTPERLNLAWTQDERDFITPSLNGLITRSLQEEIEGLLPATWHYAVDDPWGEQRLAPAIAHYFGIQKKDFALACGAGVIQLLSTLPALSAGRHVAIASEVYPDFPWWLTHSGRRAERISSATVAESVRQASSLDSNLYFLERPALMQGAVTSLESIYELGDALASAGIRLLIDESNANYLAPSCSAVHLLARLPNLIVLRGMSKAWGLGGLRMGFCLSSPALRNILREHIPPLLNPSLTLRITYALLMAKDSTLALRARIQEQKQAALGLFSGWPVIPSSEAMPYIFLPSGEEPALRRLGIGGKQHHFWQKADTSTTLLRLSVPLEASRMQRLEQALKEHTR
ncbi:aminotransferase class I/II-fold pyridoxal phosphate-dependent enzyme [unidentified bacterial endosymbiont]|uniref:aminotransferase class I/II-fold pyridoxal phosphate-dependent enzyme n=1 Tax=unidentified bacterial endosymbiont TaxID=2355 RepID=UPI0020A0AC21|nr:aminotransferase class I/II-fold pyridoxal phosphate-dependent enzyme [unidentified bacterial endosymbiont]